MKWHLGAEMRKRGNKLAEISSQTYRSNSRLIWGYIRLFICTFLSLGNPSYEKGKLTSSVKDFLVPLHLHTLRWPKELLLSKKSKNKVKWTLEHDGNDVDDDYNDGVYADTWIR